MTTCTENIAQQRLINLTQEGKALLARVKPKDIEVAWKRFWFLFPDKAPHPVNQGTCESLKSGLKSKWMTRYQEGVELYGEGVLGLVPLVFRRGNRLPKSTLPKGVPLPSKVNTSVKNQAVVRALEDSDGDGTGAIDTRGADEVRQLATGGVVVRHGNVTVHRMI